MGLASQPVIISAERTDYIRENLRSVDSSRECYPSAAWLGPDRPGRRKAGVVELVSRDGASSQRGDRGLKRIPSIPINGSVACRLFEKRTWRRQSRRQVKF